MATLALQDFLRAGGSLAAVRDELGISVYRHPELPLLGFKYSQIDSPKTHPVVRDSRGTVLEAATWEVVCKPLRRFFNVGEDGENFARFDWSDFTATTKEDGSLILLYNYRGTWHVNTSGSFGLGECGFSGKSWRAVFWETSRIDPARLDPECTYVFELCTPHNKVVRSYPEPVVFLLTVFHLPTLAEVAVGDADEAARALGVARPGHHRFGSLDEITGFLRDVSDRDRTFEGLVLRDSRDERFKSKTDTYVALHRLKDNGNICHPKLLVPLVLAGEADEVLAYLPEVRPHFEEVAARLDREFDNLLRLWREHWTTVSQKEFALAVARATPFSSILFRLRRELGDGQTEAALREHWRAAGEQIVRTLYR